MLLYKVRKTLVTLLVFGSVATGSGNFRVALGMNEQPANAAVGQQQTAPRSDAPGRAAPGRMFIAGRVLDPIGKPVSSATVMIYASANQFGRVIGQTQCDQSGAFRLEASRTSLAPYDRLGVVALAAGYGAGWVELDADARVLTADLSLRPEQVVQGRLFDLQGRPARGGDLDLFDSPHPSSRSEQAS